MEALSNRVKCRAIVESELDCAEDSHMALQLELELELEQLSA